MANKLVDATGCFDVKIYADLVSAPLEILDRLVAGSNDATMSRKRKSVHGSYDTIILRTDCLLLRLSTQHLVEARAKAAIWCTALAWKTSLYFMVVVCSEVVVVSWPSSELGGHRCQSDF